MQEQVGEACRREGIVFVPMPMETLGGWHDATVLQVKKIASAQARQTGGEQSDVTRHLYQRMAVLLAMGNAAMLLSRSPDSISSHHITMVSNEEIRQYQPQTHVI